VRAPPEACPACGTAVEPHQDYCLDCGARVVPGRQTGAVEHAWRRRFGRYPGDWIWASLALLLVAAGSATAGIVTRHPSYGGGGETVVATSPVVTAPPVETQTQPAPPTTTLPAPKPKPKPKPAGALTAWPNRNAYTVVLASIPARGAGVDEARADAKQALKRGVRTVGVLTSSSFSSLHPGYYVVFAGVFDSLGEAQTAASRLAGRYPNAYARQIAR
jgi:hypothetical protein